MKYLSTRGEYAGLTALETIFLGIAPGGGLFLPEAIPQINQNELKSLLTADYATVAQEILKYFIPELAPEKLKQILASAYAYPAKFNQREITPVTQLSHQEYLLELWHGPTHAFKDLALQLLPFLMTEANRSVGEPNQEIIILTATSGDTGKAALAGFADIPGIKIFVFFPEDGVSEIQRLQMLTQKGSNTHVIAVKGNFDDTQNGVKQIFTNQELSTKLKTRGQVFSSANSINWGRLMPQIVYYFYGYLQLCRQGALEVGQPLNVAVPTGNFGNILAAYYAKQMGLPLRKLICASNTNKVLTDFINEGVYNKNRQFFTTISPSMDILISSNLERLLFLLADGETHLIKNLMKQLQTNGSYQIDRAIREKMGHHFYGGYATESETKALIRSLYQEKGQVVDPHTAVGLKVARDYQQTSGDKTPLLLAATASPYKFNASVLEAIQGESAGIREKSEFQLLEELEKLSQIPIPDNLKELLELPVIHQKVCTKEAMGQITSDLLGF